MFFWKTWQARSICLLVRVPKRFVLSDAVKTACILLPNACGACEKHKHTHDSTQFQGDFMLSFSSIFLIHICSPDRQKSCWLVQRHVNSNLKK